MRVRRFLLIAIATMLCAWILEDRVVASSANLLTMQNEFLTVEFDTQTVSFSVTARDSGLTFVERGTLANKEGNVRLLSVLHPTWGAGETIQIDYRGGVLDRLMLFPGLPFLVLDGQLARDSDATVTRIDPLSIVLDLKTEADELRALGTAGLTGVARKSNPGSYSFLAVADPQSRAGFVGGWVTHNYGSGLLFSDVKNGKVVVETEVVKPNETVPFAN